MLSRLALVALCFACFSVASLPAADDPAGAAPDKVDAAANPVWLTSYTKAMELAKKDKKLILANFTGSDWCPWCIKLESEIFATADFKTWAAKNVILLKIDFPRKTELDADTKKQNSKLAEEFGVEGFPTVLFINTEGKSVAKTGYIKGGAKAWLEAVNAQVGKLLQQSAAPQNDATDAPVTADANGQGGQAAMAVTAETVPTVGAMSGCAAAIAVKANDQCTTKAECKTVEQCTTKAECKTVDQCKAKDQCKTVDQCKAIKSECSATVGSSCSK